MKTTLPKNWKFENQIVVIYLILGMLWIILSDRILDSAIAIININLMSTFHTIKGIFFIFVTTIILFFLLKKYLKKQNESEEKYRLLSENASDIIWLFDIPSMKFTYISPSIFNIQGYTAQEAMNMSFEEILTPDSNQRVYDNIQSSLLQFKNNELDTGKSKILDLDAKCKDGRIINCQVNLKYISDNNNKLQNIQGITRDITEWKQAEKVRREYLHFFECLNKVNNSMKGSTNINTMMGDVLETVLEIFDCDRIWLFYPCDPDSPTFRVPMEITKPEYPGAKFFNMDLPMPQDMAMNLQEALESSIPVTYVLGSEKPINKVSAENFEVQSMMLIPVYPKIDKPWAFGMHQCSYPRVWTDSEKLLFQEISKRLSDSLTSLLVLHSLMESEEKFRTLIQKIQAAVVVHGEDTKIIISNFKAQELLGLTEDQLLGKTGFDPDWHFSREDGSVLPLEEYPVNQVMTTRQSLRNFIIRLHHPNNEQKKDILVLVNADPVFGMENEIIQVIVTFIDITERKQAEQSIALMSFALNNVHEAAFLTDENSQFQLVNDESCRIMGYTRSELLGMGVPDVDPDFPMERWYDHWRDLKSQRSITLEGRHKAKDGRIFPVEINANYFEYDSKGYNMALVRDITERKKMEMALENESKRLLEINKELISTNFELQKTKETLKNSESILKKAQQMAQIGNWEFDVSTGKVFGSDEFFRIYGLMPLQGNETNIEKVAACIPDNAKIRQALMDLVNHGTPYDFEFVINPASGESARVIHSIAYRIIDEKGAPTRAIGVIQDITEYKQKELEIFRMNRSLRMLSDTNQTLIRSNDEGVLLNEVCRIIVEEGGYRLAWVGFVEYDEEKTLRPVALAGNDSEYLDSAKVSWGDNERGRGPGGTAIRTGLPCIIRNIISDPSFEPWRDTAIKQGYNSIIALPLICEFQALGAIGIYSIEADAFDKNEVEILKEMASDLAFGINSIRIRNQKDIAEESLRINEARLNEAQHIAHIGSWELDIVNNVLTWSDEIYRIFEIDPSKFEASYEAFLDTIHPDDREQVNFAYTNSLETHTAYSIEHRLLFAEGRLKYVHEQCDTFYNIDEKPLYSLGIVQDITERKLAEESLNESWQLYRQIVDLSIDMIVIHQQGKIVFINDEGLKMVGASKSEQIIGRSVLEFVHPINREISQERMQLGLAMGERSPLFEQKMFRLDGTEIDIEVRGMPIIYRGEEAIQFVARDITERKRSEEDLRESETKFRVMFESSRDAIGVSKNGFHVFANPAYMNLFGYQTQDQLVDVSILENIAPSHRQQIIQNVKDRSSKDNTPLTFYETRGRKTDGTEFDMEVKVSTYELHNESYTLVTIRDITTRKRIEEEISKLSKGIENSPVSVIITNNSGIIEYVNPRFCELTGYMKSEILGRNPKILKSGNTSNAEYKILWDTIISGNIWKGEFYNRKKNNEYYWESASIAPIFNKEHEITHFIAIKEDITEKKKLLIELVASKEKAEESEKLKTAFLQNISHEIRTPLNGILGFSKLLQADDLTKEDIKEFTGIIQKSGNRLMETVGNVLDISKIETGLTVLHNTNYFVNTLLSDLFNFFSESANSKGLKFNYHCYFENDQSMIFSDESKLNQILTNLINNALKFTSEGKIEFGYNIKNNDIVFYVKDTGVGIPEDLKHRIFTRFAQVNLSISRGYEGAGLGLSICKGLVELLGGRIWFESEVDKGTTFFFKLPYQSKAEKAESPKQETEFSEKKGRIKILIVEDDSDSNLYYSIILGNENYELLFVENGAKAVEIVKHTLDIDLILMDIRMPVMDGIEATKIIKQIKPELPIIAQTAYAFSEERENILASGCDDYVSKPILKADLLRLIEKYR